MSFVIYDISLLILFVLFVFLFLHRGKKNIKKEGLLILYRTKWGIKLIHKIGDKYKKTLKFLSYISVGMGYILMASIIYLFGRIIWIYTFAPEVVKAVKVPPIMPLIPYLPQAFNLDFLPPFYFTYWIVIIAIVAITHEFAHGIFAAYDNIRIKKTGFGFFPFFFPVFLAAFVEPDEKQMGKKSIFSQLSVLSAGTFANVLTALLFVGILFAFFSFAFVPSGVSFDSYATSSIAVAGITSIGNLSVQNPTYNQLLNISEEGLTSVYTGEEEFLITKDVIENQENYISGTGNVMVYDSAPAIKISLESVIYSINGVGINNLEDLKGELNKYSPGDKVTLTVLGEDDEKYDKEVMLEQSPDDPNKAWLGIGFADDSYSGFMGKIINFFSSFKKPHVNYDPRFDGISVFLYHLIWWTIIISISVALVNMLPMGIFDGGRFFYLTILGLTKSEKVAKKAFSLVTQIILLLIFLLMILWFVGIF